MSLRKMTEEFGQLTTDQKLVVRWVALTATHLIVALVALIISLVV